MLDEVGPTCVWDARELPRPAVRPPDLPVAAAPDPAAAAAYTVET